MKYEVIIFDEVVKSRRIPFFAIPAETGHVVKLRRYRVISAGSELRLSPE